MVGGSDVGTMWLRPRISWGAIFAGWIFAYAFALLLYLLGAAIGFTTFAAMRDINAPVTIGTGVWMVSAWVLATFIGAIFAGRLSGIESLGTGVMHGLMVWALSGLMTLMIGSIQAAGVATAVGAADVTFSEDVEDTLANEIKESISVNISQVAGPTVNQAEVRRAVDQLDGGDITQMTTAMLRGNEQEARQLLEDKTELSDEEVSSILNGLGAAAPGYGNRLEMSAQMAGGLASVTLWVMFLCSFLGLVAGAWGGSIGASMAIGSRFAYEAEYGRYPETVDVEGRRRKVG